MAMNNRLLRPVALQAAPSGPQVPGAPNLYSADYLSSGGYSRIIYFEPADGGSAITGYKDYFNGVLTTPGFSFPGNAGGLVYYTDIFFSNYTGQTAEVSAVNEIGEGPKSNALTVVVV